MGKNGFRRIEIKVLAHNLPFISGEIRAIHNSEVLLSVETFVSIVLHLPRAHSMSKLIIYIFRNLLKIIYIFYMHRHSEMISYLNSNMYSFVIKLKIFYFIVVYIYIYNRKVLSNCGNDRFFEGSL